MNQLDIFELYSPELDRTKTIRVFLPLDYDADKMKTYDVIYMHDAQNLFDPKTSSYGHHWKVPETLNALQISNQIKGYIVVGIDCNLEEQSRKRLDEYSPWVNSNLSQFFGEETSAGGEGFQYVEFLVKTVKPYIDEHYRTNTNKENTIIAGSSMGAVISLVAGFLYPNIFTKIGAFSTAAWFAKDELFQFLKDHFEQTSSKIYLDIGTNEGNNDDTSGTNVYVSDSIELHDLFLSLGLLKDDMKFVIEENARHNEIAWANRFPSFILWMAK